jgi:predicted transcriptional regulator
MIVKVLTENPHITEAQIVRKLSVPATRVIHNLDQFIKEGLIKKKGRKFMIA